MRTFARLAFALALGLVAGASGAQEMSATGIFSGHGVVKAVAPGTGWLTLDHDAIKGFMCTMEMMFQVKSVDLSKDLHAGDVVDFKIDAEKYTIVDVKLVARAN
ncbi:MAG: copper-binding protein [Roseiarcus sp.]|uniref:copper-binding protein n=1 Tax=Roseiarcus sp. TaxID=1969460 RepID=UPI003C64C302